jgi:Ca-activated chloride channel family protein
MIKLKPSMQRAFAFIIIAALPFLAAGATAPRASSLTPPQEPIRIEVDLVNVLASVVDQNHRPITNLSKDAFEIFDDGTPQKVTIFEPETHLPLDLALMIDSSSSAKMDFHQEREAAAKFIQSVVRPGDGVAVFSFAEDVRQLTGFSADIPILQHSVRTIKDGAGTALYDAVYLAATTLYGRKADRRRVIVLVTDAGESMSKSSFETARRAAIRSGALLYTVVLRPVKGENGRNTAGEHALETITQTTGGAMFFPGSPGELDGIFSQINLELRTQYRLGYYPEHKPGGAAVRKIELRVKGDYTVRYRQAYIAPGATP